MSISVSGSAECASCAYEARDDFTIFFELVMLFEIAKRNGTKIFFYAQICEIDVNIRFLRTVTY